MKKIKKWLVKAEVNMDASHYEIVSIEANTKRKALIFAERYFKNMGFFHVANITVEEVPT